MSNIEEKTIVPIRVGKEIFTILSESLYNNPYHLFREYVQNSIDSINNSDVSDGKIKILLLDDDGEIAEKVSFEKNQHLLFVDNGRGYENDIFDLATTLAKSSKSISQNIGYKGIGRLSGYSYSDKITFLSNSTFKNNDALTMELKRIKSSESNDDTFNIYDFISKDYDDYLTKYLPERGFIVQLKNIAIDIKNKMADPNFKRELSIRLKCKYDMEKFTSLDKDIIDFATNYNASIYYDMYYNNEIIERLYVHDKNKESDYIKKIISKDDKVLIARVIYKIGRQVTVSYRKNNLDDGIRVYHKGMLVSQNLDVAEKIISYFGLIDKSPTEYYQALRTFYTEIHIEVEDIIPNSSRTWFSYYVPDKYNRKYTIEFMDYLNNLIKQADTLRYSYSYFARKSTTDKDNYKKKLLETMEFFVKDFQAEINSLEYMFIDPHEKESKEIDRKEEIKENRNYLIPSNSGYYAKSFTKLNEVIEELNSLNINQYINASAMLYRSFLEMSLKYASRINKDFSVNDDRVKLYESLKKYNEYLKDKNIIRLKESKANSIYVSINEVLEDKESIRILNNNIHDLDFLINKVVLLNIRNGLLPILDDIYEINDNN